MDAPPRGGARGGRWVTAACWLAAAPVAAWALLRLTGLERGPLVLATAFTPYVAAVAPAVAVLALALRRRGCAVVAALAAVALAGAVAPRAVADDPPPAHGPVLRLLTANLRLGSADAAALVALLRAHRVDVLTVQELTPRLAADLDRLGLATLLPHRSLSPEVGSTGSGVYARHPLRDPGHRRNQGFFFTQAYGTLAVPGAPPLRVESAHPAAPYDLDVVPDWWTDQRAQPPATPRAGLSVLAGDFNATLDHAALRALIATGYTDAADAAGAGLAGTWGPYDGDPIPPVTIDHVLVDRRIAVRSAATWPVPGSDHRALLTELRLPAA
ncbi:endonuclease/exonuclease/phosphatase family protein [Micromonospora sp. WMMD980]|uniref:endonuclease/exonuclease/phosphatase family protein n=1 Tax=Micromonospora sp. WMMD980 TaxID=3016088 RepID=UPI0024159CDB|nr:endonuclease/exonuclease/phosphatase family protein [Micromonospora sp. WMMD980]MDG4802454.1 endonuclease/exonuclease/phosphatase family protein [Micromonospora sp. WMMD980]